MSFRMVSKPQITNEKLFSMANFIRRSPPIISDFNAVFVYYVSQVLIAILIFHFYVDIAHYNSYFGIL